MKNNEIKSIRRQTLQYTRDINRFRKSMADPAFAQWPLLMAFALWGIPDPGWRAAGSVIVIIIFSARIYQFDRATSKASFSASHRKIMRKIDALENVSPEEKDKLRSRIYRLRRMRCSGVLFNKCWVFMMGYTYLIMSFLYQVLPWIIEKLIAFWTPM